MKHISTTALAKIIGLTSKELFAKLSGLKMIDKDGDSWVLTEEGKKKGGGYKESAEFGKYIVWPENLEISKQETTQAQANNVKLITSTVIGKHFELSANKVNYILSELGWIKKGLKGWLVTEHGVKQQDGVQTEDKKSGIPFARWPEAILESKSLIETVNHVKGTQQEPVHKEENIAQEDKVGFREKFEAKHRSTDGHFVRSKAEMLIDNWLYMAEIVHAYERKLPIEEDVYSDFYIPAGKVYIEYWGYENDEKYLARKKKKQEIYQKYGFNLIELADEDVQNLDDILPKLLLKHGVQAY